MLDNDKKYRINLHHLGKAIRHIRRSKKVVRTEVDVLLWCYHHGVFKLGDYAEEFGVDNKEADRKVKRMIDNHLLKKKAIKLRYGANAYYLTPKGLNAVKEIYRFLRNQD